MKHFDFAGNKLDSLAWGPGRWSRWTGWRVLLLCLLFGLGAARPARASHYRYSSLTWRTVATDPSLRTIEFKVSRAYRRSATAFSQVTVGSTLPAEQLDFGDGSSSLITLVVTSVDVAGEVFYGETNIVHTYATTGDFVASFTDCCRLSTLVNNANGAWYVSSAINVGTGNNSPVSTLSPVVNLATGQANASFLLPASDPDGDPLTFSLATAADLNGNAFVNAPGLAVDANTGRVSLSTTGLAVGGLYNAIVKVSDGRTSILVDFIISITASSTPPVFDYSVTPPNGFVYRLAPGQTLSFGVRATDADAGDTVRLQAFGLPLTATTAPAFPVSGNPVQSRFSWTPTAANLGTSVVYFVARDLTGVQTSTSVTIEVSTRPQFDVPPTPANQSLMQVTPGTNLSMAVQASAPNAADLVSIVGATGTVPAMAFSSGWPTAQGNPTRTQLTWTPAAADWGPHAVTFTARSASNQQATHTLNLLINSAPSFTSQPANLALTVGQSFVYTITTTDPDLPYGDRLDVLATTLPSWLRFVNNGNGTATLSGTATRAGAYPVTLDAEDIYHHGNSYGRVMQAFTINVAGCSVAATATATNPTCAGAANGSIALAVTGATAPATYAWTGPNGFRAATQNLSGLAAGTYAVTVTGANGCTATAQATLAQPAPAAAPAITVSIVGAVPVRSLPNTIFLGYGPQTATLTATGGTSYRWSPAAGLSNPTSASPVFAPRSAGQYVYTVTATNASGCTASASVTLNVVEARCGNNDNNPKVLVCHNGHEICISPNAVPAHIGPGSTHNDLLGSCNTNAGGSIPAPVLPDVVLTAFPNPVASTTTVNFQAPVSGVASVRVFNQMGVQVATLFEGPAVGGREYQLEVDASRWPAGLYLCQYVGGGQTSTQRLMVNK
ncbi:T9SS type A sorting domain-containing protein [Hymenobacter sp. 5317J-9]|uniref:T9SS type A sorting domain-containing protein n=1 Tax=Hymenobacter sp. 5317J-9 TaxID=2932250 RepID=UPI001FD6B7F4|nr:T9SS type A sorting domain-containing protein [Hymenobacter sp. 5317J-9]UOQ97325.1 T9SS type A sorting domain-containing protein [Hymenobacter sp. 5317J-9]